MPAHNTLNSNFALSKSIHKDASGREGQNKGGGNANAGEICTSEREGSASCNLRIFCISNKYSLYVIAFCVQLYDKRKRCIESNKLASLETTLV